MLTTDDSARKTSRMPGRRGRATRLARVVAAAALVSALAAVAAPASFARAAEQPVQLSAMAVDQPGPFFDLTMIPGETRRLEIALANHGQAPVAARTYAADVYTIVNGGFGAELRDGVAAGTTTWLTYPGVVLTLEPDRASVRGFLLTVPAGTAPGEYLTSVVLENAVAVKGTGGVALDQVVRQAVAVAVRVPGPLTAGLAIGAARHKLAAGHSVVAVEVSNTGNRRLTPAAELVVRDRAGAVVSRSTVPMDSFYAHTSSTVEITLAAALAPGGYTVDLTLDDGTHAAHAEARGLPVEVAVPAVADRSQAPVARQVVDVLQTAVLRAGPRQVPVWAVALAVLGLAVASIALLRARRRRPRSPRRPGPRGRGRVPQHARPARPARPRPAGPAAPAGRLPDVAAYDEARLRSANVAPRPHRSKRGAASRLDPLHR